MIAEMVIAEEDVKKVCKILSDHSTVGSLMETDDLRHLSQQQVYEALHILEDRERARRQDPMNYFRRK
ncbi:MAG TPA: hypothetical protein VKR52_20725 [Terracidiphilus sp.]|nr:hypothetical protein [Terracidiphilus sp.]